MWKPNFYDNEIQRTPTIWKTWIGLYVMIAICGNWDQRFSHLTSLANHLFYNDYKLWGNTEVNGLSQVTVYSGFVTVDAAAAFLIFCHGYHVYNTVAGCPYLGLGSCRWCLVPRVSLQRKHINDSREPRPLIFTTTPSPDSIQAQAHSNPSPWDFVEPVINLAPTIYAATLRSGPVQ